MLPIKIFISSFANGSWAVYTLLFVFKLNKLNNILLLPIGRPLFRTSIKAISEIIPTISAVLSHIRLVSLGSILTPLMI